MYYLVGCSAVRIVERENGLITGITYREGFQDRLGVNDLYSRCTVLEVTPRRSLVLVWTDNEDIQQSVVKSYKA